MNIGIYRDNLPPTKPKKQCLRWVKFLVVRFHSQALVRRHCQRP